MTTKNNFANLNNNVAVAHCVNNSEKKHTRDSLCVPLGNPLLSNFLTSSTFDSLSRKIKIPCSVIKKFKSIKEIFKMQNLKNKKIFTYMVVGALVIALSISCKNEDKTGGGSIPTIPTASGSPATVGNAEFSGTLNNISIYGNGWTKEQVDALVMANNFSLGIENNKAGCSYITPPKQLLCPDSSNPNVVETSAEEVAEDGSTFAAYIKITLDNAANPTTATVEYHFKLYSPEYSGSGMSDTVVAVYEGTLNKVTSGS